MHLEEYREWFISGTYMYDTRNTEGTDDKTLFDIAMNTVRENRYEEPVAWIASKKIQNPELLTELVLGASEFVVSELAITVKLDDAQLIRIIKEIEDNKEKWISPLDVEPDDAWGYRHIRQKASRKLRDKKLLIEIALEESDSWLKAYYICRIAEQKEALRRYLEKENSTDALMVVAACTHDIRILKYMVRKLEERCAEGGEDSLPVLTVNDTTLDMAALRSHLSEAMKEATRDIRSSLSEQRRLQTERKVEEVWAQWDAAPESERTRVEQRQYEFLGENAGHGWQNATITIDGVTSSCRISYLGNSVSDFVRFVEQLADGDYGYFAWSPEGGVCKWFISRRDPYVYVEAPGFESGTYLLTEMFRRETLRDVFRCKQLLRWS